MPYGTRWQVETENPYNGHTVIVYIEERDYSGSVTELEAGGDMVVVRYTPIGMFSGTPHWVLSSGEVSIEFIDDGTGQLSDVLSGDDEKYQILVQDSGASVFYGYVVPDSYGYVPYQRGTARLTATDRLHTLYDTAYLQSTGFQYSGRQSAVQIIANALSPLVSGLPIATHCNWYPYIGSNDLDETYDPLDNLFIDNAIFYDDDGNPVSCGYVLEQICGRFQLQCMQALGRWLFVQRRRNVDGTSFPVFLYNADGSDFTPDTSYPAYAEIDGVDARLVQPYMTGAIPYGSVSVTYNHGNPFTDLFSNLSFEDVLFGIVGGTPLSNAATPQTGSSLIVDGLPASVNIPAGMRFTISGLDNTYILAAPASANGAGQATLALTFNLESAVADNTALTFLEDVGNWQYNPTLGSTTSSPNASDGGVSIGMPVQFETSPFSYNANNDVTQRSADQVAGGSAYRLQGGWDVRVEGLEDVTTELYMAFQITVGAYYYKWSDSTWTTTATTNEIPLASFNLGNNQWDTFNFTTGTLDDTGTPISGYMQLTFREGHEFDDTVASGSITRIYIDNVQQPVLIDANFLPAGEATQTTITYDGNVNRSKPDAPQFIIGDGPTIGHIRRLVVRDSIGTMVEDVTGNWNYGPPTLATGYTLDQFWCDEMLKQYRRSPRRLSTGVFGTQSSGILYPWQALRIANPNNTSEPDYYWQDVEWRPAAPWNVLSGTYVEYVAGTGGNLLCEYSVPGSSVASLALTIEQGIPCADGGTAIAPSVESGTLFFTTGTSSNTLVTANSLCRRNTDGSVTALHTFTGTAPTVLCLDETERWVFVVQGLKIWRMRYDGSDVSEIYEESGFETIGGIVFVPGGTYVGQIVYTALTTSGTNEDVYRMLRDGTGRTKISTNQYLSNDGGIVLRSNTEAWCSAGFSGASIVSYGLAGTVYGFVQTQQTFNNQIGIAYDPAGNRVWTQSNGDLRQTNTAGDNYTTVASINNGSHVWWDATGARLFYGGSGLRYRAGAAIGTQLLLSPLTIDGNYGVNQIVAVQ